MPEPLDPRSRMSEEQYDTALYVVTELLDVVPDNELEEAKGFLLDAAARKAMNLRAFGNKATRTDLLP
ncbi:MAG: hypothetical protein QM779_13960 [Propionicimonas sp.]|uniref:hypothetical protein n=1 Tax=Propionicimonas sp. TaxID=1955623 RepID=UPI003D0BDFE7